MRILCHFAFSLILFQTNFVEPQKQAFQARFDTEKWLKEYDIINITVKFVSTKLSTGMVCCYLHFVYNYTKFTIALTKIEPISKSTIITIDGQWTDTNQVSNLLSFYQCYGYQNKLHIKCTMVLTNDGLDGILKIETKTLIIEPVNKQRLYMPTDYCSESQCRTRQVFSCIIYKPGDILDNGNIWYALKTDDLYYKQYPGVVEDKTVKSRQKRNTLYTDCSLHIVADHTFYIGVGHEDVISTIAEMLYFVTEANTVFRSTDFNGDGSGDNIGFYVAKISIFTSSDNYKMADSSLSVYKYLDSFSEYDLSNVCLGTAFTSRDFADGVLGLAWVASSSTFGASGGICQKRVKFSNKEYSLNTNIITVVNSGERIPAYKSALTLTHEFGHSFGSPHDKSEDADCVPGDEYGNYLMYPYANDGSKPNHNQFSPCSIGYMFPVIKNKGTCFTQSVWVCGNGIKEEHEECDCGPSEICNLIDPSCTPSDAAPSNPDPPCTIRRSAGCECSLVSSPCCTPPCQFSQPDMICRHGGECVKPTYCSGVSGDCPQTEFESDEKLCNNNRRTCRSGRCIGSICSLFNSTECDCEPGQFECYICCSLSDEQCSPGMLNDTYIEKSVGSACRQMKGFCDKHAVCILQDPDSVVKRLNDVFSPKSMNELSAWLGKHWYYVLTGATGLIFLAAVFFATFRQRMDVQTSAFMYGQFMRIIREAEIQKHYIEERKKVVKAKYDAEIEKIEKGAQRMKLTKALARLKVFFPTAANAELEKVLKISSKEEMAVSLLLMKGFPLRRISKPVWLKELKKEDNKIYNDKL